MRRSRLYHPSLQTGVIEIDAQEAHHAGDVLRLGRGDEVVLFDGHGHEAPAIIDRVSRGRMTAHVESIIERPFELPLRLTLAVALPRAQRQAYLVEKCTELGVSAIWPIISERSVVKPGRGAIEKLSRRAIEAAKQAQRAYVPSVQEPIAVAALWKCPTQFDLAVITHLDEHASSLNNLITPLTPGSRLLICVGPEGGWTDDEVAAAAANGFHKARLGPTVLRIETAAIAACAAVYLKG